MMLTLRKNLYWFPDSTKFRLNAYIKPEAKDYYTLTVIIYHKINSHEIMCINCTFLVLN